MRRRDFLYGTLVVPILPAFATEPAAGISAVLRESELVYLSPIKSNGDESSCQGEVWYVYLDTAIYVVTQSSAWRVEAIEKNLAKTRMWVGNVGMWKNSEGKYKTLPRISAFGSVVENGQVWDEISPIFAKKYHREWSTWGPRFRQGLESGSRTLLKYTNIAVD